jgi:hypothetical protein
MLDGGDDPSHAVPPLLDAPVLPPDELLVLPPEELLVLPPDELLVLPLDELLLPPPEDPLLPPLVDPPLLPPEVLPPLEDVVNRAVSVLSASRTTVTVAALSAFAPLQPRNFAPLAAIAVTWTEEPRG